MANVFSVPIFFIAFRECLEAALIIAILLGLVEQIVSTDPSPASDTVLHHHHGGDDGSGEKKEHGTGTGSEDDVVSERSLDRKRLIRKLRIQIFAGAITGLLIALAIGAAFIAVWFTQAKDFWSKAEALWEGIFFLVASLIIFVMGVTMLKLDQAKVKWRVKLQAAFDKHGFGADRGAKTGRWMLFFLPCITVLREGLEAVVFIGGVSLGQPARSIPLAAICGLLAGLTIGFVIYQFASRFTIRLFLIVMTNFLLLIGAGLFSRSVGEFQENAFNHLLGADADDAGGDGPGSFDVKGNVWHLECCNPDNKDDNQGWSIFGAIFGWSNNGSVGTVLAYVFYWLAVVVVLVFMKYNEGRTKILGKESKVGAKRRIKREEAEEKAAAA